MMITDRSSPDPIPNTNLLRKASAMNSESLTLYETSQKAKLEATMNRKPIYNDHFVPNLLMLGSVNLLAISSPAVAEASKMPISKLSISLWSYAHRKGMSTTIAKCCMVEDAVAMKSMASCRGVVTEIV